MKTPTLKMKTLLSPFACCIAALLASATFAWSQDRLQTMNIVYPAGAFHQNGGPVINMKNTTLFSPNAVGDGVTDDTAAFVAMMDYIKNRLIATGKADPRVTIYLPTGTYLVSNTITHTGSIAGGFSYLRLVGQNRANTTIRLKNNSAGFGSGQSKPVIAWTKYWENYQGNVMWGNQLRNITIDTGTGNPGAVGMAFFGANGCSIDNVTIRSGDGFGNTGLLFPGWSVQGHFCDITVDGFDYGIQLTDKRETNANFEYVTLKNQKTRGLATGPALVTARKLLSQNSVPAVSVGGAGAQMVLLDSRLEGGASGESAIRTIAPNQMDLFARNVQVAGYGTSVTMNGVATVTGHITEWLSGTVFSIGTSTPAKSMNLPVEEAPLVPWESNPANWASPEDYTGTDGQKIQAALNSGKPAVIFPKAYNASGVTLTVPASVRQLEFLHQVVTAGSFRLNEGSTTGLWMEHPQNKLPVHVNAARTVNVRYGSIRYRVLTTAPVTAHFQTMAVLADAHLNDFCPSNAKIYNRSPNEESSSNTNFVVNGGLMWVTGFKTERPRTAFEAKNGGLLEVLGGYQNFAGADDQGFPVVLNNDSNVTYVGSTHMTRTYWEGIWEIRNGVTTKIRNSDFPRRSSHASGNYVVPMYVGYNPAAIPGAGQTFISEEFNAGGTITNQSQFEQSFLINNTSGNQWNYTSTGGIGSTGALSAPGGQNVSAVHKTAIPGFGSNPSITQSFDAFINYRTTNEPTFGISHWSYLKDTLTIGNAGLALEFRYVPPASRTTLAPERLSLWINGVKIGVPNFAAATWNRFEITWTRTSSGTFDASVKVSSLGATGTSSPVTIGTYTRLGISQAAMSSAAQVYAGLQGRATSDTGVFRVDNLKIQTP